METISKEMAERVFNVLEDALSVVADPDGYISREAFYEYIERALDKYFSNQIKE